VTHPVSVADPSTVADPWAALPSGLAPLLRAGSAALAADIVAEIRRAIPEYALVLHGPQGTRVLTGIEVALHQFVDQVADPTAPREQCAHVYRRFGRGELAGGRSLEALQAAYRIGARVAWRHFVALDQRLRLSMPTMCLLGEAMFAHIDELAALAAEGYATAQTQRAGLREQRRRRLLELVLAEPAAPWPAVLELAKSCDWTPPERIRAVAVEPGETRSPARLSPDVLIDLDRAEPCLLAPESGRVDPAAELARGLPGRRMVLGPPVRLADAARSLRWARRGLALLRRGMLADRPVVDATAYLSTLLLFEDEALVAELAERVLAPLAELTSKQRDRLADTLLAWLRTRGGAPEIAARLGIHPQTVRHRMHQVHALFGDRLGDPDARFDLEIALRARELRNRAQARSARRPSNRTASTAPTAANPAATSRPAR
jgi:hypothetical protein